MPTTDSNSGYYPSSRDKSSGNLGNTPLMDAAVVGDLEKVNRILNDYPEHPRYINLRDNGVSHDGYENTALILAIFGAHTKMAIRLIDCGADVTIANNRGITPLHYACIRRDHQLIEKLLSKGARWDAKNKDGVTPLDFYLYDLIDWPGEMEAIRELELLTEHRPDGLGLFHARPAINDELLTENNLNTEQKVIPALIKNGIPRLVKLSAPVFISNNPQQFEKSIFKFAFASHDAFMLKINEIKATDPSSDINTRMREITQEILENKYGQPRTYIKKSKLDALEPVNRSPFAGISMMVLGGFIAAIGIAAVALAFTLLKAATLGIAGLVVATVGVGLGLSRASLFATKAVNVSEETPNNSDGLIPGP